MLENYLLQTKNNELLAHRKSKPLDEKTFHTISILLADFAVEAFGFDGISNDRKKMIAKAAVSLFAGMKYTDSDGDGTVFKCFSLNLVHEHHVHYDWIFI